jgi:hypothetical protein
MKPTYTITGDREMLQRIRRIATDVPRAAAAALYTEAEIIMTEAKNRTPVDTGALRASGHVSLPEIRPGVISVALGFGGPAVPYALFVHEDLDNFHAVGQAKFLESALLEAEPHLLENIAARIREELE